jgi:hypothetical protein
MIRRFHRFRWRCIYGYHHPRLRPQTQIRLKLSTAAPADSNRPISQPFNNVGLKSILYCRRRPSRIRIRHCRPALRGFDTRSRIKQMLGRIQQFPELNLASTPQIIAVELDAVRFQNFYVLVAETLFPVMRLLIADIPPHSVDLRFAHRERAVTRLPREFR